MPNNLFNFEDLNVLVVDEHSGMRMQLKKILSKLNFQQLFDVGLVQDAIQTIENENIDLVLCDIHMRHGEGLRVLQYIRERNAGSDVPFIVISGEASENSIVQASDLGISDYILKPFQTEDVEDKVNKVLNAYFTPSELNANIRLGDRYFLMKEYDKALEYYEKAISINIETARAHYGRALSFAYMNKMDLAEKILIQNIDRNPNFYKTYRLLADIAIKKRDVPNAIHYLEKELELHPKQSDRQIKLASLKYKSGDLEGSLEAYRGALVENAKEKKALIGMGHLHIKLDNFEKALYYFHRARKHYPNDPTPIKAVVRYSILFNNLRKGELFLKDEKSARPKQKDVYPALITLLLKQDKKKEALDVVEELIKLDKDNPKALHYKASVLFEQNQLEEAEAVLQDLVKIRKNINDFILLAKVCQNLGKNSEAESYLERALRSKKGTEKILELLASGFLRQRHSIKAMLLAELLMTYKKTSEIQHVYDNAKKMTSNRRRVGIRPAS